MFIIICSIELNKNLKNEIKSVCTVFAFIDVVNN